MTATAPRVALLSVGLGRVQRGFERYFADLHEQLSPRMDLTLFRSAGDPLPGQRVPGVRGALRALTALVRLAPLGRLGGHSEYHRDCIAFALALWPALWRGHFDVVHVIDPPLAQVLGRLRRAGVLPGRLLFTEGTVMPPSRYPAADHIHLVARTAHDAARAAGVQAERLSLLPCGLHPGRFAVAAERHELRAALGLREGCFVVLGVAALKSHHKRVPHLVDEVARLAATGRDVLLWLDGHPEEPAVAERARAVLGERCRITHVPPSRVGELYHAADVLAHAAIEESFGLGIAEAMCCALPVRVHASPHFRWLTGDAGCGVDMTLPGALAASLAALADTPPDRRRAHAAALAERARARFDWRHLAADYEALYRRVAAAPSTSGTSLPRAAGRLEP